MWQQQSVGTQRRRERRVRKGDEEAQATSRQTLVGLQRYGLPVGNGGLNPQAGRGMSGGPDALSCIQENQMSVPKAVPRCVMLCGEFVVSVTHPQMNGCKEKSEVSHET